MVVFIVGGSTFQEARLVAELNAAGGQMLSACRVPSPVKNMPINTGSDCAKLQHLSCQALHP